MLPLLLIGAGIAAISAFGGAAVSNWTNSPTTNIESPSGDVYLTPEENSGIGISNTTLLIAAAAVVAVMVMKK